jgi:hypothetical protein
MVYGLVAVFVFGISGAMILAMLGWSEARAYASRRTIQKAPSGTTQA